VTRYADGADEQNKRTPCMHDPAYIAAEREKVARTSAQAAPYSPPAYTLGDENYLCRSEFECCRGEETMAAFREWLGDRYGTIAALNAQWATEYAGFDEVEPITIAEAAQLPESFARWIDHKLFMDTAFAEIPLATCISDEMTQSLRAYVEAGGTLIVDGRAGILSGQGRIRDDRPLDALLGVQSPEQAVRGQTAHAQVNVRVSEGRPDAHVVRMDIYAPGSDIAHREYSQNILVRSDAGYRPDIPFALNDERGEWWLVFRDVASGVTAERTLMLQ